MAVNSPGLSSAARTKAHDALDSAYATLGLRRGAAAVAVKRRYRALVRQWHPDQFANDPQSVADATLMLKAINRAYSKIVEHRAPDAVDRTSIRQPSVSHEATRFNAHFTPQQRDEIIDAIRHSESLLAMVFDDGVAGWRSRVASIAAVLLIAVMAWESDQAQIVVVCILPLLSIWFPDAVGALSGAHMTPAPARVVWLLGWGILLALAFGVGFLSLRQL